MKGSPLAATAPNGRIRDFAGSCHFKAESAPRPSRRIFSLSSKDSNQQKEGEEAKREVETRTEEKEK